MIGHERSVRGLVPAWADLLALTRPGVLVLVLVTAPPAFALGYGAWPAASLMLAALAGTGLLAGGCSALNAWLERDRDAQMARTRGRPLPSGRLAPGAALAFGLGMSGAGLAVLAVAGGWLAALIGVATLVHYVGVYTLWLKPWTPQNIVIGGAAGATAPLMADAVAHQSVGGWSLLLAAIVFFWTPPHFWAIALFRKRDYDAADFPMMPAVIGAQPTRWRMLGYAVVTVLLTLAPAVEVGLLYGAIAGLMGVWFCSTIARSLARPSPRADRQVFIASVVHLTVVFAALAAALV